MAAPDPVLIVLTPEQRAVVKRLSGQHVEAIELTNDGKATVAGPLRFGWRLSKATGIPRQVWSVDAREGESAQE